MHRRRIRRDLWFDRAKAEHDDIGLEVRLLGEAMRIIGSQKDIADLPPAAVRRNRVSTGMIREMTINSTPGLRRRLVIVFLEEVGGSLLPWRELKYTFHLHGSFHLLPRKQNNNVYLVYNTKP